jgi:hypothetical protein
MQIPLVTKRSGTELPPLCAGALRYVVAREGVFLERSTELFTSCTRIESTVEELASHVEGIQLACGKLPRTMIRAMLSFFRAAYALHGGEAALVLLYHPAGQRFRWYCPPQSVTVYRTRGGWEAGDMIRFEQPLEPPPGYLIFGDAHSHGSFMARPSSVDHDDEEHQDGLHLIVGRIHRQPEYHADFVLDGRRFKLDPKSILADTDCAPFVRVPRAWMEQISMRRSSIFFTYNTHDEP